MLYYSETKCKAVDGFAVDVLDALAKMFNFKWNIEKYPTDEWITSPKNWSDPNSTFTGMFGKFFPKTNDLISDN